MKHIILSLIFGVSAMAQNAITDKPIFTDCTKTESCAITLENRYLPQTLEYRYPQRSTLEWRAAGSFIIYSEPRPSFEWKAGETIKNLATGKCAWMPKDGGFYQSRPVPCPDSKLMKTLSEVIQ